MNADLRELVQSILRKDSLDDCPVSELQQLARKYPFFAASHLLLARKLSDQKGDTSGLDYPGSGIYFTDPLWIEQMIHQKGDATITAKQKSSFDEAPQIVQVDDDPVAIADAIEELPTIELANEIVPVMDDQYLHTNTVETKQIEEPVNEIEPVEAAQEAIIIEEHTETVTIEDPLVEEPIPVVQQPVKVQEMEEAATHEPVIQQHFTPVVSLPDSNPPVEELHSNYDEDEVIEEEPNGPEISIPQLRIEPIDPKTAELSFQPYHTVDYFGALGIKAKDDEKPKDKFGQQLKSFTEWLKVLKKAPVPEAATANNPLAEEKVEQMAQTSVSGREVVTEAMAEVWEKQGNHAKAVEIYRKLSLLNPSKSAYFATLIEQLKQS